MVAGRFSERNSVSEQSSKSASVVLVTGGAKGVGKGITACFLQRGHRVIICGRETPAELPAVAGSRADFIACDIRKPEQVDDLFKTLIERHGRLDVLVNNAGGAPFAMAAKASPRFHDSIIALNLTAPLNLAQKANAIMQTQVTGGVIVNVASISALRPSPGTAAYGAAKAGMLSLTQSLAVEWAPKVRVVAVSPGLVLTEQSHLHYGDEAGLAKVAATIPMQRLASPQDIGEACVWLASPAAAYATGTNLVLHGGGERPAFLDAASVNQGH